jgi:hypothetical protein
MTNPAKLQHIRAQADMLGVKYHHRAGVPKIQELIDAHLEAQNKSEVTVTSAKAKPVAQSEKVVPITAEEFRKDQTRLNHQNAGALVRCRVQCMDPQKKNWPGDIFSVGSAKVGTFKKYVPFDSEDPWHIPKIIVDMLEEKMCSVFVMKTDDRGHKTKTSKQVKAYTISIEEPLTAEEMKALALRQAMAAGGAGR